MRSKNLHLMLAAKLVIVLSLASLSSGAQSPPREPPYTDIESAQEESAKAEAAARRAEDTDNLERQIKSGPPRKELQRKSVNLQADAEPSPEMEREMGLKRTQEIHHPDAVKKGLIRIDEKGSYYYRVLPSPQKQAGAVMGGPMTAPQLSGSGDDSYKSAYGDNKTTVILASYEYQFLKMAIGKLGLRVGTGFLIAQGNGRFVNNYPENRSKTPKERFDLIGFPNNTDLVYRMQFWDKQPLIPYAFGGGDYWIFAEMRNDNRPTRYSGALAAHVGGGLCFSFNWLDRLNMSRLDQEYGINNIMISGEVRQMLGIKPGFLLNSQLYSMGITAEF